MIIQKYKREDVVIKQGAYETWAYMIMSGKVEVSTIFNGQKKTLATFGEKQIFGEMALIEDKARSATVTALEDTKLSMIGRKDFNVLLTKNPKIVFPIIKALFDRLRSANDMFVALTAEISEEDARLKKTGDVNILIISGLNAVSTDALGGGIIKIDKFPYKIGRKQDSGEINDSSNNLDIEDSQKEAPFNIATEHVTIDKEGDKFSITDMGSEQGTIVNGKKIEGKFLLENKNNSMVIGTEHSPFVFTLEARG